MTGKRAVEAAYVQVNTKSALVATIGTRTSATLHTGRSGRPKFASRMGMARRAFTAQYRGDTWGVSVGHAQVLKQPTSNFHWRGLPGQLENLGDAEGSGGLFLHIHVAVVCDLVEVVSTYVPAVQQDLLS